MTSETPISIDKFEKKYNCLFFKGYSHVCKKKFPSNNEDQLKDTLFWFGFSKDYTKIDILNGYRFTLEEWNDILELWKGIKHSLKSADEK